MWIRCLLMVATKCGTRHHIGFHDMWIRGYGTHEMLHSAPYLPLPVVGTRAFRIMEAILAAVRVPSRTTSFPIFFYDVDVVKIFNWFPVGRDLAVRPLHQVLRFIVDFAVFSCRLNSEGVCVHSCFVASPGE